MKWMIQTDKEKREYQTVTYNGGYRCTCPQWEWNNSPYNPKAKPGYCKHIWSVNGGQVSVRQRKYGHIVKVE